MRGFLRLAVACDLRVQRELVRTTGRVASRWAAPVSGPLEFAVRLPRAIGRDGGVAQQVEVRQHAPQSVDIAGARELPGQLIEHATTRGPAVEVAGDPVVQGSLTLLISHVPLVYGGAEVVV